MMLEAAVNLRFQILFWSLGAWLNLEAFISVSFQTSFWSLGAWLNLEAFISVSFQTSFWSLQAWLLGEEQPVTWKLMLRNQLRSNFEVGPLFVWLGSIAGLQVLLINLILEVMQVAD
jgi:hypothetical protein